MATSSPVDVTFEVEGVVNIANDGVYVFARQLAAGVWSIGDGATLGGCAVVSAEVPRALDAKGIRVDLFAFKLRQSSDQIRFSPGQKLDLKASAP